MFHVVRFGLYLYMNYMQASIRYSQFKHKM